MFLSPPNGTLRFLVVLGFVGWRSRCFRRRLFFVYSYLLSSHLTWCYGLLWIILFKLYVFTPYHFSFIVCPSVLDDLPPLVAVLGETELAPEAQGVQGVGRGVFWARERGSRWLGPTSW